MWKSKVKKGKGRPFLSESQSVHGSLGGSFETDDSTLGVSPIFESMIILTLATFDVLKTPFHRPSSYPL